MSVSTFDYVTALCDRKYYIFEGTKVQKIAALFKICNNTDCALVFPGSFIYFMCKPT